MAGIVPKLESVTLMSMILTAKALAKEGRLAEGYTCLAKGLRHAEQFARQGAPWADELRARYRKAVDRYITRYGVRLG